MNKISSEIIASSFLEDQVFSLDEYKQFLSHTKEYTSESFNRVIKTKIDSFLSNWIFDEIHDEFLSSYVKKYEVFKSNLDTSAFVIPEVNKSFRDKYTIPFFKTIQDTNFISGEDNQATLMFSELLHENDKETLKLLNDYFIDHYDDVNICVKILTLLNDYSYFELKPTSQTIALASISSKFSRVKSAALNLFAHWGCPESLKLLNQMEAPSEPWIRMKYNSVKESLEKRCSMLVK